MTEPVPVTGIEETLGPWLDGEPDRAKRDAVLEHLFAALDDYEALWEEPAAYGHPLQRRLEVPEADVALVILLRPVRFSGTAEPGIHVAAIDPISPS